MEILDGADGLILMIDYAASRYDDSSIERFKDIFLNTVHAFVANDSQEDVTVDDLRKEIEVKQNFFDYIVSKFRRKR